MNEKQYPLQWPMGWQRTKYPQGSRFRASSPWAESRAVIDELRRLGATNIVISSNMEYKADGTPYARQARMNDTGVAVYFKLNGDEQCIPCDQWYSLEENLRAIWKTVEALRGIERWGAKEMVNAAFRGFKALPSSFEMPAPQRNWWVVLDVSQNANALEVKEAYRKAIKLHHPDAGGSAQEFQEIKRAYEQWENL